MVTIVTERLILRDFIASDENSLAKVLKSPTAMHYIMDLYAKDTEGVKNNLDHAINAAFEAPRNDYFFAVTDKITGEFIGSCGFSKLHVHGAIIPENFVAEMGYFFIPHYWGKGYGKEAARALVQYAFTETACRRLTAGCASSNLGSSAILTNCGFHLEGILKAHQWIDGLWEDRLIYGLNKGD